MLPSMTQRRRGSEVSQREEQHGSAALQVGQSDRLGAFLQGAPGALAIGATNAGSFGGLDAIAPEKMDMARQAHPWAEGAGEIAGVLANQGAANRLFPMGRIPNPIARNLAYDTPTGQRAVQ